MQLRDYCRTHEITLAAVAAEAALTYQAVQRYAAGDRVPRREAMRRLFLATDGQVRPDDFLPLQAWQAELDAQRAAALGPAP